MNTTHPIDNTRSGAGGIHRGIWVGGGLMALTIIALATTLVVRSNGASDDSTAPQAAVDAAAITAAGPTAATNSSVAQTPPPVVVAQQPAVHHAPVHHEAENRNVAHDEPQRVASVPVCATCGVIDGYSAVQVQGQTNGVGAVAGGVGGALLGSKIAGRGNHTLGGAIGAIGGGLLGNAVEKHERTVTMYDVRVRMNDGSIRTVRQAAEPHVGARVNVEGNTLRAAPEAQG